MPPKGSAKGSVKGSASSVGFHARRVGAAALLAAGLAGCQALGGGGGVMPESDVGPPPSMRGSVPGQFRTSSVDEDGKPIATTPTRRLDIPKNAGVATRTAEAGPRRISRDEIEGAETGPRGSSGGLTPSLTGSGGVGVGGSF